MQGSHYKNILPFPAVLICIQTNILQEQYRSGREERIRSYDSLLKTIAIGTVKQFTSDEYPDAYR